MRNIRTLVAAIAAVSMLTVAVAVAQQPRPQHGAGQQPSANAPTPGMPGQSHDAHHAQHMEMCRQMMGQTGMMGDGMGPGMMGGGMMPMMMGGDPKQQAEMLAMRGEMMKAMGDIMMKYAQRMQPAK
jgi:hypothetical protein